MRATEEEPPDWCDHCGEPLYLFVHEPLVEYVQTRDGEKIVGSRLALLHEQCLSTNRIDQTLSPPATSVATVEGHFFVEWQDQLVNHGFSTSRIAWMTKRIRKLQDYDERTSHT